MASPSTSSIRPYRRSPARAVQPDRFRWRPRTGGRRLADPRAVQPAGRLHPVGRDGLRLLDGACAAWFPSSGEWRRGCDLCSASSSSISPPPAPARGASTPPARSSVPFFGAASPRSPAPSPSARRWSRAARQVGRPTSRSRSTTPSPRAAAPTSIFACLARRQGRCSASRSWSMRSRARRGPWRRRCCSMPRPTATSSPA